MSKRRLWWRLCLLALWAVFPGRAAPVATNAEPDIRRDAAVIAIEKVMPSVVNIATETLVPYHDLYDEIMGQFFGWQNLPQRVQRRISLGSGVIIDEDGYILTNVHVIRRANRIQVKLWDGREYEAEPCSYAETSDVALIKLKAKPGEKFKAIQFAADDDLLLGETVLALGNPFGLGGSVTKGILSSKNRRPARPNEPLAVEDWLQTDAAINPGNSGGPLVNLRGELIGLNVAVYREQGGERGMGVSFSIPVKQVSAALSRSFTPEATEGMWFGAQFRARSGPLMISEVQPSSPADKAGLRVGERVLEINGQVPRGFISSNRLLTSDARHEARLTLRSGLERREVTVRMTPFEEVTRRKLGLTLDTPPERAATEGLPITEVEKGSPAGRADLQHGYLLAAVDGQRAASPRMVGELLSRKNTGDTVALTVTVPRRLGRAVIEFRQGTVEVQVR